MIHAELVRFFEKAIKIYDDFKKREKDLAPHIDPKLYRDREKYVLALLGIDRMANRHKPNVELLEDQFNSIGVIVNEAAPDFRPCGALSYWEKLDKVSGGNRRAKYQIVTIKAMEIFNAMKKSKISILDQGNYKKAKEIVSELKSMD